MMSLSLNRPTVRTRATVADGSDLTIVVPTDDPVEVQREGQAERIEVPVTLTSSDDGRTILGIIPNHQFIEHV